MFDRYRVFLKVLVVCYIFIGKKKMSVNGDSENDGENDSFIENNIYCI